MNDSESDAALMLRVQQQDTHAFERLMQRHSQPLHSFAYRHCQNADDAREIVQDAFLRVWSRSGTWKANKVKFTTWIYQITRNLCIDRFRKQSAQFDDEVELESLHDPSQEVDKETILAVRQAVQKLPERQRTALILCQLQGWSQSEVASLLQISVEATESLLARARRTLRTRLSVAETTN